MTLTCDEMRRVDDLQQLALELLEIEKKYLLEEKEEYSCAVVVVITTEGRYYEVVLGRQTDFEPAILNMLPNWP